MCLAVPGRILEIVASSTIHMGKVDFGGVIKEVCLEYLPEASVGDYAIVHAGMAISRLDEDSALATLKTFAELGMLSEELDELRSTESAQTESENGKTTP